MAKIIEVENNEKLPQGCIVDPTAIVAVNHNPDPTPNPNYGVDGNFSVPETLPGHTQVFLLGGGILTFDPTVGALIAKQFAMMIQNKLGQGSKILVPNGVQLNTDKLRGRG